MQRVAYLLLLLFSAIPLFAQDPQQPQITSASFEAVYINRTDLQAGTARIPVIWEVANYSESMNLAFEQIMPDGSSINIELPHANPWNAAGRNLIAPIDPGANISDIQVQVRLYVVANGETLDIWQKPVSISEPPANPDVPEAHINHFSISSETVTEGDTITATWDVSGVEQVGMLMIHNGLRIYAQTVFDSYIYPNAGTASFTVPDGVRVASLNLYVNANLSQTITISINCRFEWSIPFYENSCPTDTIQSTTAIYQRFEGGYMISSVLSDYIWVYADEWGYFQSLPVHMPYVSIYEGRAPEGLFRPENDFGIVWSGNDWLRDVLGWATAPEESYTMNYQRSRWGTVSSSRLYYIFNLPDGTIINTLIPSY